MADVLCLMKGSDITFYDSFYVERDNLEHSGNWSSLETLYRKGIVEGHFFKPGYYGDRLDNRAQLCPVDILMRWNDDC